MKNKGYTLIELLIVACTVMLAIALLVAATFPTWNIYYTQDGIFREIHTFHPEAARLIRTKRHCFSYSEAVVVDFYGNTTTYYINTNILFNYEVFKAK